MGILLTAAPTAYNRAYHWFALLLAGLTCLLILAGALVTSNEAGLSVPDWPTSFGSLYRMPPMGGGGKYEHGHRMVAEFVGLLCIVFVLWTCRARHPRCLRGSSGSPLVCSCLPWMPGGGMGSKFYPWV